MTGALSDPAVLDGASARLLDALPVAVAIVDRSGRLVFVNSALCQLTGFHPGHLVGRDVEVLVPEPRRAHHRALRRRLSDAPAARAMGSGLPIWCVRADGTSFAADISLAPLHVGERTYVVATIRDDTERRAKEADLAFRALHDPLTGLANRSLVLDRIEQALGRASRGSLPVTVLFVDLDHFKDVNDQLGHKAGDDVLVETSRRLESAVRPGDNVGRLGGDEFVVVCEGLSSPSIRAELADRIVRAIRLPMQTSAGVVSLTASVGVAVAGAGDAGELLAAADEAMYGAKRSGGDRSSLDQGAGP